MKHLDVLVTFVKHGLEKKHVKMIANMIVPDKVHGEYNMLSEVCDCV